jgi:hypothetical protein
VAVASIPSWKERLKACFRMRHRFLQVFGASGALGALVAVGSAAALNPDVGMGLGALTAAVGALIAGYYVTAGFDRKLVTTLQQEETARQQQIEQGGVQQAIYGAAPELRPVIERIAAYHASIEGEFSDGITDSVEAILQNSRSDLKALRDRAVSLVGLHARLRAIITQSDGRFLWGEVQRLTKEYERAQPGAVRDALTAAKQSAERTFAQWQAAVDKQKQISSVLTMIESNLQEFKLAMELRKADAAMGGASSGPEVSELQARLAAAGEACDELVGRATAPPGQRQRRRQA